MADKKKLPADEGGRDVMVLLEVRRGNSIEKSKALLTEKQAEQLSNLFDELSDY